MRMDAHRHARHYIGFVDEHAARGAHAITARMQLHRASRGSAFLRAANERGIQWHLMAVYPGGRTDERKLKEQRNSARHCWLCEVNIATNPRADAVARRHALGLPTPGPRGGVAARSLLHSLQLLGLAQLYGELKEYE